MRQRIKGAFVVLTVFCVLWLGSGCQMGVHATETDKEWEVSLAQINQVFYLTENAEVRNAPDETAEVLGELEKDVPVYVLGQTSTGWYQIYYNASTAYIGEEYAKVQEAAIEEGENYEERIQQFIDEQKASEEARLLAEEQALQQKQAGKKKGISWGIFMSVILIFVFLGGLIFVLKSDRTSEEDIFLEEDNALEIGEEVDFEGNNNLEENREFEIIDLNNEGE